MHRCTHPTLTNHPTQPYPPTTSRRAVYPNGAVAARAADDSTLPERAAAGVMGMGMVIEESGALRRMSLMFVVC